ncbi:MAG: hypothetical protein ACOC5T_07285 [Elusimicrobiota bacterium]
MKKFYKIQKKSLDKEGVKSVKELWEKVNKDYEGLSYDFKVKLTKDKDVFHSVFSTSSQDRDGDVIFQNFELDNFKKNPVFLDSHRHDSISRIIGKVENIAVIDGKLQGDIRFALDNPIGELASKLAEKGFLNTTSIGFIPKEFDGDSILLSEILEISAVAVPSNPEALLQKMKKKELEIVVTTDNVEASEEETDEDEEIEEDNTGIADTDVEEDNTGTDIEVVEDTTEDVKVEINPKSMIKETLKEISRNRYEKLKTINETVKECLAESKKKEVTKKEKRLINKAVRDLLTLKQ